MVSVSYVSENNEATQTRKGAIKSQPFHTNADSHFKILITMRYLFMSTILLNQVSNRRRFNKLRDVNCIHIETVQLLDP